MAKKPEIERGRGRQAVREVLVQAPGYWRNLTMLARGIERLTGILPAESEVLDWVAWNQGEGYVDHRKDKEFEEDQWKINKHGLAREEL